MSAVANTCPDCGATRPANAPGGLCPQCLLRLGLGIADADPPTPRPNGRATDSPASPARSQTIDLGAPVGATWTQPVSGILDTLDLSFGPVPRVLLRDGPADEPRPVRPTSEEMPDLSNDPGRYQLLGEIARGGIGVVIKGRDIDLGRDLAVKVLLEKHRDHPEMVRRFVEEAQIGGQLQHPGIVPVHELGRFADGRLYIAMKLVRGRTLAVLLEGRSDPADERSRFLSIFEQVCQTMAYAHARGVVHRDLKPSNIMVGNFGEVQVMDWGLAKVLDQGGVADDQISGRRKDDSGAIRTLRSGSVAGDSRAGSVLGTPAYMAPEQARGALDTVDERADVFGLGSILCEILTGAPAFTGSSSAELYRKAERADLDDALARLDASGIDRELIGLARSCLSVAPKDRPRDAGVVLARLTAYLTGVEARLRVAEVAKAQAEARAVGEHKRRILTVALAASIAACALIFWAGWAWTTREYAHRAARATSEVNKALDDALDKLEQARENPDDSVSWVKAIEASRYAVMLVNRDDAAPELRSRVLSVQGAITRERDRAEAVVKDRRIVERLAEIHNDFGVHFDAARTDAEYAAAFRDYGVDVETLEPSAAGSRLAESPVAPELANALDQWAFIRRGPGRQGHDYAARLIAIAKTADPDPWRNRLRDTLQRISPHVSPHNAKDLLETLEQLAEQAKPEALPEASVTRLASALSMLRQHDVALSLLRPAQRVHPNDFWLNCDLGRELMMTGNPQQAVRFFSVAVAIRSQSVFALERLGDAFHASDELDDAVATYRRIVEIEPDRASAHVDLGAVLLDLDRNEEAKAEFAAARELGRKDRRVRERIHNVFLARGDWDAAIAELQEAIRHDPNRAQWRDRLGSLYLEVGRVELAAASFRKAAELDPGFHWAHNNLGTALMASGEFQAARDEFQRGQSGADRWGRNFPSEWWLSEAGTMIALEPKLSAILHGQYRARTGDELARFARLCSAKKLYAASARFWTDAFSARPELARDRRAGNRYEAARAAALAGSDVGLDQPRPDSEARARWRKQALNWLSEELAVSAKRLENDTARDRDQIPSRLGRWFVDPAFAGLRDEVALNDLPEPERAACREFWTQAESVFQLAKKTIRMNIFDPPG
jgi:serine/threonine-protein kinase